MLSQPIAWQFEVMEAYDNNFNEISGLYCGKTFHSMHAYALDLYCCKDIQDSCTRRYGILYRKSCPWLISSVIQF